MDVLSLLNAVMRDSWRETELKKKKNRENIKDSQGEINILAKSILVEINNSFGGSTEK